jgi:3-dehydroquinate synthase
MRKADGPERMSIVQILITFTIELNSLMADNILFSTTPAQDLKQFLTNKSYSKIAVLTDENTFAHCFPLIEKGLPAHQVIQVKSGEEHKNIETCGQIWNSMTEQGLDRHAVLIVLGGGVLGDMGGFCAATYKRGIDFILIPTTLLSQVDASIGGKLGIDFNHFKNHIGVFQIPAFTLLHSGFLKTLPQRELRSGFAEIIKHTLISDVAMWKRIRSTAFADLKWEELIRHSVDFKSKVVTEDPKEKGLRKILNAGHTVGHAIETYLLRSGNKILHGEAIAAGLITEMFIAKQHGLVTAQELDEVRNYILNIYGKLQFNELDLPRIAALTLQDKKNSGDKILCVLLNGIGNAKWDCEISTEEVKSALTFYRSSV